MQPNSTKIESFWVYRLKNGKFYKRHNKGSWAVSLNGVNAKEITTNLANAERFNTKLYGPPYDHPATKGGEWVEIEVKTSITILV